MVNRLLNLKKKLNKIWNNILEENVGLSSFGELPCVMLHSTIADIDQQTLTVLKK